jgi:hypothetical protein
MSYPNCMVQIEQIFLKRKFFFYFRITGLNNQAFMTVKSVWDTEVRASNSATRIAAKFKLLSVLRRWGNSLSQLKAQITQCYC